MWGTPSQPATVLPGGPAKGHGQFSLARHGHQYRCPCNLPLRAKTASGECLWRSPRRENIRDDLSGEKRVSSVPVVLRGFHPMLVEICIDDPGQQDENKQEGGGSDAA